MSISFDCPHCGFHTNVAERFAGHSGACANCQKPITLPGKATAPGPSRTAGGAAWLFFGGLLALVLFAAVLVTLMYTATTGTISLVTAPTMASQVADRVQCGNNLERVGQAILDYVDDMGHFPPAYVADEKGKPIHSWRVLLLPYLDEDKLYAKYDMTKPWDDPVNLQLVGQMPSVFRCPMETATLDESTYMLIAGDGFLFHKDSQRTPADVTDGPNRTLMLVEVVDSGVPWTEPKDLNSDTVDWNRMARKGIGSEHVSGGFHVLMADGTVFHLGKFVTPQALADMATIAGGESTEPDAWTD